MKRMRVVPDEFYPAAVRWLQGELDTDLAAELGVSHDVFRRAAFKALRATFRRGRDWPERITYWRERTYGAAWRAHPTPKWFRHFLGECVREARE